MEPGEITGIKGKTGGRSGTFKGKGRKFLPDGGAEKSWMRVAAGNERIDWSVGEVRRHLPVPTKIREKKRAVRHNGKKCLKVEGKVRKRGKGGECSQFKTGRIQKEKMEDFYPKVRRRGTPRRKRVKGCRTKKRGGGLIKKKKQFYLKASWFGALPG